MDTATTTGSRLLEQMSGLSESVRGRLLLVLESQELTVSELCAVLQLPQSTVSRHLKILVDQGWIRSRPDGTRRLYRMSLPPGESPTRRLWLLARTELEQAVDAERDARRLQDVLAERRTRSEEFFSTEAGRWDAMRDELFGAQFFLAALPGLLGDDLSVADLGCGSGAVTSAVAPFVDRVVAVDGSAEMLSAARRRLSRFDNVDLRRGNLEELPLEDDSVQAATLILVLHHLPDPARALAEALRVLAPGGTLLIADMLPHDRHEFRDEMGHVWLGFSQDQVTSMLRDTGFASVRFQELNPTAAAKGPALFAASGRAPSL
ncbi:MAG: metalloregulator ArsR/SmtB family transcription factor [bacterium]|nr:metalloregulator ArsR/SmtB family transcription factor [bacterium]